MLHLVHAIVQPGTVPEVLMSAEDDANHRGHRAAPLRVEYQAAEERRGALLRTIAFGRAGNETSALLVQPATTTPRGGALFLHWFAPDEADGDRGQFADEAIGLAEHGIVSLLPQQVFPWSSDPSDAASDREQLASQLQRHRQGLDVLEKSIGTNLRVAVVGHDFGAMYAAVLLNIDRRPSAAVLIAGVPRWGDWFWPFWRISGKRTDYFAELASLDPENHLAEIAGVPLLFQFADRDYFVAGMTAWEFHRAAGEPKEVKTYESDHSMRSDAARADREAFLLRSTRRGVPLKREMPLPADTGSGPP
jgi:pimeloyl-ACP methyl ester carboxylesterase